MYIDPSASALILQLLVSAAVGFYLLVKRSFHKILQVLLSDVSKGLSGLLIAVSFANLTLLRIWTELFGFTDWDTFEMKAPPPRTHFAGALLDLLLIALLVWLIVRKVSTRGRVGTVTSALLLMLCIIPLNAVREVAGERYFPMLRFGIVRAYGPVMVSAFCVVLAILGTVAILCLARPLCQALCLLLLGVSPFTLFTAGRALAECFHPPRPFAVSDEGRAHRGRGRTSGSRVVWLLFDEMDQRITFEDRPKGLKMPEFDRLRSTALYANAVTEAGEDTNPAIPSMLTGRAVVHTRELGPAHLGLTFAGGTKELDFSESPHLFRRAGAMGFSSGVAGLGFPYCRLFGAELDRCWWCESERFDNCIRTTLSGATIDGLRSLLETKNFSPFGQSICLRQHIKNMVDLTREAISLATSDDVDLAFLHLHGAHPPHVYDRRKLDYSLANSPIMGYTDSLALCDLTLGRIRSAMERRGLWHRTTILVASDHHSRSARIFDGKMDHRSMFILKMAGQDHGSVFSLPMSALTTGDLVLEILQGEVRNADDASDWLAARSQRTSERM